MISARTAWIDDNLGRGTDGSNPLPSTGESNSRVNFATAGSFVDEVAMVGDTDPAAWGQDDSAWPH
jgi:hypothetical protein